MLGAMTENYESEDGYFITGIKTNAGKNRVITISPKIRPFFEEFAQGKYLFTGEKLAPKKFRNSVTNSITQLFRNWILTHLRKTDLTSTHRIAADTPLLPL